GCGDKKTLLKPGAEKLLSTFKIANDPEVEDLSGEDEIRYRVKCRLTSMETGRFLGTGIGECSSEEEKYKWKKAVCNEEWEETDPSRRREKWFKGYGNNKPYQVKQIRTNPADVANTVLKMGKKRSLIDGTLTVTAASDIFAQDLEDVEIPDSGEEAKPNLEESVQEVKKAPAKGAAPTEKSDNPIEPKDIKRIYAKLHGLEISDDMEQHVVASEICGFTTTLESMNFLSVGQGDKVISELIKREKAVK
ncbi:hypothetical protein LCGC14_3164830, partial [marine sediment metagenome]